jgi:GH15 family glucan-1,4-alpha-glucosidase
VLVQNSIAVIERYQDAGGAYPAGPAYPVYRYCWLRDGAFIADAMSRIGRPASADAFFGWCARLLESRAHQVAEAVGRARAGVAVPDAQMLPTRYELDGADGVEPWENFQLDGYGTWLWALVAHARRYGVDLTPYRAAAQTTVDYLTAFGTRPCYDWWEEHTEQRHVSTLAAVQAGLRSALEAGLAEGARAASAAATAEEIGRLIDAEIERTGHLTKWLGSDAVDGSLLACLVPYGTVEADGPAAKRTAAVVKERLLREGVYRYLGDTFYGGGEWIILTAWLGWYEARTGDLDSARARLAWIERQSTPDGLLPEQVTTHAQRPDFVAEWQRRWGPVATPLLWSHAMYLTLAKELGC